MPSTSAGVWTAGTPPTVRADAIALEVMVRFRPARAKASPDTVIFWPGLTVVALRPMVNGALLACAMAGVTGAPPDVAARADGAPARAVAAIAPTPASLRGEMRKRDWGNMGSPFVSVVSACPAGAFSVIHTVSTPGGAAVRIRLRHFAQQYV